MSDDQFELMRCDRCGTVRAVASSAWADTDCGVALFKRHGLDKCDGDMKPLPLRFAFTASSAPSQESTTE